MSHIDVSQDSWLTCSTPGRVFQPKLGLFSHVSHAAHVSIASLDTCSKQLSVGRLLVSHVSIDKWLTCSFRLIPR
jgi:hypothetical protein